jgi:copper resistance protein D
MLLWGASAYLSTLVPSHLAQDIGQRLRSFAIVAAAVAIATTIVSLPLETAMIGEGWSDALDLTTIRAVLFETSIGQAWRVQAIAALILAATLALAPRRRPVATALAAGFLLASIALTGHAAMQDGWPGVAHRVNDAVHVLSSGAWLGALVPLLIILWRVDVREADLALRRFSTTGHVIVALVIASGVIDTVFVLGRWPTDWSSPYQAMLASKIALVAVMVGLAMANRYVLVPRITPHWPSGVLSAIRLGTIGEIALGVGIVGLVSIFGMLDPM